MEEELEGHQNWGRDALRGFNCKQGERWGRSALNDGSRLDAENRLGLINTRKEVLIEITVGWVWEVREDKP